MSVRTLTCLAAGLIAVALGSRADVVEARSIGVASVAGSPVEDPITRLQALMKRVREGRVVLQGPVLVQAKGYMADTRLLWSIDPSRANDAALAMLDVMGLFLDAVPDPLRPTPEADLRDVAAETLQAHLSSDFGRWLATEVLSMPRTQPIERRLAVMRLFERNTVPSAKLALLACTRESEPRIRMAALRALVGWEDDVVHACFLAELERDAAKLDPTAASLAEKHFGSVRFAAHSRVAERYAALVRVGLVSTDWRTVVRATVLQKPLENEVMIPDLIEALSVWKARADEGVQSLRVRHELRRALRERSGRAIGLEPEDWRAWWELVRSGSSRGFSPQTPGGVPESTEATFFGIRPMTDRVVFVLDRSGSMNTLFGRGTAGRTETGHRRWDEAVGQMVGFLEDLGPKCSFDVVLFHDLGEIWKGKLVPATPENVRAAKDWLRGQPPNGSTHLRAGVDAALRIGPGGTIDVAKLEADTVIVLCDGETAEGPAWVDPFLEVVVPVTRIVFHGVQIGSSGDETLMRLARGSRGDFVRIGE